MTISDRERARRMREEEGRISYRDGYYAGRRDRDVLGHVSEYNRNHESWETPESSDGNTRRRYWYVEGYRDGSVGLQSRYPIRKDA